MPEHVARTRGLAHRSFLIELARLEKAMAEVFDAPETKPLTEKELAALRPRDLERARLVPWPRSACSCSTTTRASTSTA